MSSANAWYYISPRIIQSAYKYFIVFLYRDKVISTACIIVYVNDFVCELPYHVVKMKYTHEQTIAIFLIFKFAVEAKWHDLILLQFTGHLESRHFVIT